MRKRYLAIILLLFIPITVGFGYESGLLNLVVPTTLEDGYAEFSVQHRFYTPLEKIGETVFGDEPQGGANVGLGLRINLGRNIEVKSTYSTLNPSKGYSVGAGVSRTVPRLSSRFQVDIEYFSYLISTENREGNAFILLSWQSDPILSRIRPTVNMGYNHFNETFGVAPGVSIRFFGKLDVIGEYYFASDPLDLGLNDVFAFGLCYRTYGHHFMLVITNAVANGARQLMRGAPSNDLYVGFNLFRLLQL
ncbi:MAG TPA: hypothetical protein ENN17_02485 [bacterium]|nr:hypothetical protein [bacterium]